MVQLRALSSLAGRLSMSELQQRSNQLANEVDVAVRTFGVVTHQVTREKVFAYEVDGFGSALTLDDANTPNLLSLPLLGYVPSSDPIYLATRRALLSAQTNPWFVPFAGTGGLGSPHTGFGRVWPMSLMVRALTTDNETEIASLLDALKASTCT